MEVSVDLQVPVGSRSRTDYHTPQEHRTRVAHDRQDTLEEENFNWNGQRSTQERLLDWASQAPQPDQCFCASACRLNGLHLAGKAVCVLLDSERLRNLPSNQLSTKTIIGIAYLKLTLKKLIDFGLNFSIHSQNPVRKAHTRIRGLISR